MANLKFLKDVGYSHIYTLDDDGSAFFYEAGVMIDAADTYGNGLSEELIAKAFPN